MQAALNEFKRNLILWPVSKVDIAVILQDRCNLCCYFSQLDFLKTCSFAGRAVDPVCLNINLGVFNFFNTLSGHHLILVKTGGGVLFTEQNSAVVYQN